MINYEVCDFYGFEQLNFEFEGRKAIVVKPQKNVEGNKWLFKTEYFGAFPNFEIEMLKKGYHIAYIQNETRWCLPSDIDIKDKFCEFLSEEFSLNEKCMCVGMSCGGMHGIYFAAKYPRRVAALYLDAPVVNLLSCPCAIGVATDESMYEEFKNATGMTKSDLINYRNHPVDHIPELYENNIPIILVCGDSDCVVPYIENGKAVADYYEKHGGKLVKFIKPGCDHHPHGLEDNTPIIKFAIENY